ncbi:MAG: septum formation initiator family protein [Alphaproteobacteria bacterium]|nr:septum formation initiator family protein [Alphaproteobacteria bacterium]
MIFFSSPTVNKNIRFIFSNIIWICIACYFTYHIFTGARGALSWALLSHDVIELENNLKSLKEENAFLENKIRLLRNNSLDLDLLEEEAQSILGLAKENEIIVLLPRE